MAGDQQSKRRRGAVRVRQPDLDCGAGSTVRLEPHVCRVCLGRVASQVRRVVRGGAVVKVRIYLCTSCGAEGEGAAASVCGCGVKVNGKDAGWRCGPNPNRGIGSPSVFVLLTGRGHEHKVV